MDSRIAKSVDFPQSVCTSYGIHSQNRDHSVDIGKIRYSEPSVRKSYYFSDIRNSDVVVKCY